MKFQSTDLAGVFEVEVDFRKDSRGAFGRIWCAREFAEQGLVSEMVQGNCASTVRRGTLRGLHYQVQPAQESKLVRCIRGSVYDVVVDLRADSESYGKWLGITLTAGENRMVYIPTGCAHGYQTLEDDSELFYLVSEYYSPEHEKGVRWNDPAFGIEWPLDPGINISDKDRGWSDFVWAPT